MFTTYQQPTKQELETIKRWKPNKRRKVFTDEIGEHVFVYVGFPMKMHKQNMSEENWELIQHGKVIKIPSPLMPKRMSKKTMRVMHERLFYIVKKSPHGKATTMYHCYDMETRDFILCDHDKERLLRRLKQDYYKYKEKYNEH